MYGKGSIEFDWSVNMKTGRVWMKLLAFAGFGDMRNQRFSFLVGENEYYYSGVDAVLEAVVGKN